MLYEVITDYEDGALPYDVTPDSDKESHVLKARVDLPSNTMVLASYVNAETESKKSGETGIWDIGTNKLTTTRITSYNVCYTKLLRYRW